MLKGVKHKFIIQNKLVAIIIFPRITNIHFRIYMPTQHIYEISNRLYVLPQGNCTQFPLARWQIPVNTVSF